MKSQKSPLPLIGTALVLGAVCFVAVPLTAYGQQISVERTPLLASDEQAGSPNGTGSGAFVGVHSGALIVAGGIEPVVTAERSLQHDSKEVAYVNAIAVATRRTGGDSRAVATDKRLVWRAVQAKLPTPRAYGISASHERGLIVIGGTDGRTVFTDVFLLRWSEEAASLQRYTLPSIPHAAVGGSAAFIGDVLYVILGPEGNDAEGSFYALDLSQMAVDADGEPVEENGVVPISAGRARGNGPWRKLESAPYAAGKNTARTHALLVAQNNGRDEVLFVFGGRAIVDSNTRSSSVWQYNPSADRDRWTRRRDIVVDGRRIELGTGSAVSLGPSHVLVLAQTGRDPQQDNFGWADSLNGEDTRGHTLSYNAIADAWAQYPITTPQAKSRDPDKNDRLDVASAVMTRWGADVVVRADLSDFNHQVGLWTLTVMSTATVFGWQNMVVLILYLLAMVLVGVYFVFKNKDVNDYFRGGQNIPWWAAACSMYATMLSSLTYVAMPALVYRTDWVVYIGVWMILVVAPIAVYIAMPFFRQIDATSAYEYLSKRFNLPVRLFASGLFTLFHIGRMGIVMALTALALAAVTPFDAWQCVLIMGVLCLIYCTMGGIEAVIWTDTIQTGVLLIGAVICFVFIVNGIDGGLSEFITSGVADDKFRLVNLEFGLDSFTTLSIWVIVLGGLGQNLSSYTADQAVVQRYMTTRDTKAAAKSIWANGILAPAASVLFFTIGTGLYVFYQSNPGKLDPTMQLDQIFPAFISTELPVGIAGLIIAGIFAAAQSTVSTSMNSIATTLVTDFMRPFDVCRTEHGYLSAARWLTFTVGVLGTLAGLLFISPEIRSLMEEYFKVIGMFMGALGGLFVLGVVSTKANSGGAMIGLLSGVGAMLIVWEFELANGYLFAAVGILVCLLMGYGASAAIRTSEDKDLQGLTLHTMREPI